MENMLQVLLVLVSITRSYQHGYMSDPPSRSSMWRDDKFKKDPRIKPNYNDNQLFCGGMRVRFNLSRIPVVLMFMLKI